MAASPEHDSLFMFDSYEEADEHIRDFEVENHCRFVKRDTRNHTLNRISSLDGFSIRFEERNGEIPIEMEGIPFVILGTEVRECHYGPDRSKPKTKISDHQYAEKSRKIVQHSKKQDCPAKIRMRLLIKFPDYQIARDSTQWRRRVTSKALKEQFNSETTRQQYQIRVKIENHHSGHLQGEVSDFCQPLDKRVISKIHNLVEAGCHSVTQIQKDLEMYVKTDLGVGEGRSINRRFFPKPQDVRNHVYNALRLARCSEDDQTRVSAMVDTWRSKYPRDRFFFRPASVNQSGEVESFLFVHQTELQQHLLQKYGSDVVIMDATYKTTKYDIPLFLLCVLTNVGYHVVGSFLIGRETTLQIKGALQMLSSWNSTWSPTHFMTDMDLREINAIEETFTGTSVLTCEFHRDQAWRRGLQRNGLQGVMKETLQQLRSIGRSETEEDFRVEVERLKASQAYLSNTSYRNWVDKYWLAERRRWVSCFINLPVRVTTTNGLEAHNRVLKQKYLHENNLKTMSSMLAVLIEKYIPESMNSYKEKNISALESHRRYNEDIPQFLKNRPKPFLDHCLSRLDHDSVESIQANEAGFLVKSSDSGNTYQVTLQPNVCCSCPDWKRFHWPCKHILNVVVQEPNVEWESLSASFTRQPWFILDTFGEESTQTLQTDLPRQEITEPEADQESIPDSISSQPCFSLDASFGEDQNSQAEPAAQANPAEPQETVDLVAPVTETSFIEVPESDTIERSSTIQRRFCLEIMKNIQNSLYIVDNPDILYQAHNSLAEISRLLDENTPKLCNLPLWTKRGRRKRNIHKQPKSSHRTPPVGHKLTTRHETALKKARLRLATARSRPQASTTSSNEDYIQCGAPPNECLDAVRQIWQSGDDDGGRLIGRVGPYNITDSSVKFMQSTLSDETIDAYLYVLTAERADVCHINCVTITSIFTGRDYHGLLQHVDLLQYETFIGAVNEGGNHWTLMIIRPRQKELIYMNPLGESNLSEQQLLQHWYAFLRDRFVANLDDRASAWSISSPLHARQYDNTSCGLYVIKLAERYLLERNLLFVWSPDQILRIREYTAAFLISKAVRFPETERDSSLEEGGSPSCTLIESDTLTQDEGSSTITLIKPTLVPGDELSPSNISNNPDERSPSNISNNPDKRSPSNISNNPDERSPSNISNNPDEWSPSNISINPDERSPSNISNNPDERSPSNISNNPDERSPSNISNNPDERSPSNISNNPDERSPSNISINPDERSPSNISNNPDERSPSNTFSKPGQMQCRAYNLRNIKEKRQSSSFFYPPIKRVTKRYCVCKSMDDGTRGFWECAACNEWFHPTCVGYSSAESAPVHFICPSCLPHTNKSYGRVTNAGSSAQNFLGTFMDQDEDEEVAGEDNYLIDVETAASQIDAATDRVHAIMTCSYTKNNPMMKRHHHFKCAEWFKTHKKGYGVALFSPQAILFIRHHLKKQFYTSKAKKIYSLHGSIKGITDGALIKLFEDRGHLAEEYLEEVLLREAMACIFQEVTNTTYDEADRECRECENMSAKLARWQGASQCSYKKEQWLQKINRQ